MKTTDRIKSSVGAASGTVTIGGHTAGLSNATAFGTAISAIPGAVAVVALGYAINKRLNY